MFKLRRSLITRMCYLMLPVASSMEAQCQVVPPVLVSLQRVSPTKFNWFNSYSVLCVSGRSYFQAGMVLIVFGDLLDWSISEPSLATIDHYA